MNRRHMLKYAGASAAASFLGATRLPAAQPQVGAVAVKDADALRVIQRAAQAGTMNAVWVHGTAFEAEDSGALNGIQKMGWGTLFHGKPKAFTWFHISIPTPVIINDHRPALEKLFVFYKENGASIRNVHIYDGPRKIKAFDGLMLRGDQSGKIVAANTWAFAPPVTIAYGLGISIGVQFSVGFDSAITTEILFTTAGADFRLKPAA
ncbi:MAG: hypothetical protein L0Z50_17170 [Verrucomicrobiales bacterium]|nr:hypothetical protein [Verrucomicrobiales bacterium]